MANRLTGKLTLALSLCWLLAVGSAALLVRYEMNEVFDSVLQETAQQILPDIIERQGAALLDPDAATSPMVMPAVPHDEYITYQVMTPDGRLRLRSHQAPNEPYSLPMQAGFSNPGGGRVYTEPSVDGRLAIQIAEPLEHRQHAIRGAILWLVLPLGVLIPLSMLLVPWTVRREMRPLLTLQSELRQRNRSNMAEIATTGLPQELQPILADVNLLLLRLSLALESERSFASNTAHELRTPMASALAHAQLLAAELGSENPHRRHAVAIAEQLRRLSRYVTKLLELARAEAGVALQREPVDLLPVLHLVIEEFVHHPGDEERWTVDFGARDEFVIETHADAIAIVLRNLLENAVLHGTPGGPIGIRLHTDGALTITNDAPVIPPPLLGQLTERFHRAPGAGPGSGLGLAIIRAIMQQCGGSLVLHSPACGCLRGFEAELRFPGVA